MASQSVEKTSADALLAKCSSMSAGYIAIPENNDYYRTLMECMTAQQTEAEKSIRRQSPLVNTGYAMRVGSLAHSVHSFVSFHVECSTRIDIVLLGCGLDTLGLWASSLAPEGKVHIWEVDTTSVATGKRDKLIQQGIIIPYREDRPDENKKSQVILEGMIRGISENTEQQQEITETSSRLNYHLVSADLCDINSLASGLQEASLLPIDNGSNRGYPTLVLIELVLAYLGKQETDRVLEWCNSHFLARAPSGSTLVAFEALGEGSSEAASNNIVQAYQKEYSRQFQAKLQRGRSQQEVSADKTSVGMFHPLGSSVEEVQQRLHRLHGYSHVYVCLAGTSAWWAARQQPTLQLTVPSGELFDEHAALTLHLSSYVQVVAFSKADTEEQFLLRWKLCPWQYEPFTKEIAGNRNAYVSMLEPKDVLHIRDIFSSTYEALSEQYPAVKKMVKSALKKELSTRSDRQQRETGESVIRLGYQAAGGDFLVAVQYHEEGGSSSREVLGGIGVRRWKGPIIKDQGPASPAVITYEIHRFFVSESHRGRGVGTSLLEMAEFVARLKLPTGNTKYRVVATTLAVLTEANHLYTKSGYTVLEETAIGDLNMKTFVKEFP